MTFAPIAHRDVEPDGIDDDVPHSSRAQEAPSRRSWARTALTAVALLLATVPTPAGAQVPTDRPVGIRGASAPGLAPFAGRRVVAIDITGHNMTKDWVITREIRTKVGDSLDVEAVGRDVARLDNLSDLRGDQAGRRARG